MSKPTPKLLAMLVISVMAVATTEAKAECTCRFPGGSVKEGESACIKTVSGPSLARCEKVQNVTSWKVLNQPCSIAQTMHVKALPKRGKLLSELRFTAPE
jgi:hypothetical protein